MFFALQRHAPPLAAAYPTPAWDAVQNIVGPSAAVYAVQMQLGTTVVRVCDEKQYSQAAAVDSNGPSSAYVMVVCFFVALVAASAFGAVAGATTFGADLSAACAQIRADTKTSVRIIPSLAEEILTEYGQL